jgi:hypothetical protein
MYDGVRLRSAREDRMRKSMALIALTAGVVSLETSSHAAIRVSIPSQDPGPPFYASIARPPGGQIFQDGEWAAIPFLRDTTCAAYNTTSNSSPNLLDGFDPGAHDCKLAVHGFAIYNSGLDPVPVYAWLMGDGAVPIWFVRWSELRAAIPDDELTVGELESLPSLLIGSASFFEYVNQIGVLRPQGEGNGKIEIASSGTLNDGRAFQFSVREMGVDQISTLRHVRIEFR